MLNKIRKSIEPAMEKIGRGAARTKIPPTGWTLTGLLLAGLSGAAYAKLLPGGQVLAALFLLSSGFLDMVDGSVARLMGKVSAKGAFLDSTIDRLAEIVVFTGIIWGGDSSPLYVLIALSLSMMVSYSRARGEALGVKMAGIGVGERAERILVLVAISMVNMVEIGVIAVALLAAVTFLHRLIHVARTVA
ncbi:MAG: CDP-alcohol phosphatidyltransferase family protein [Thaumarchaeota archaeon]|nr:CDP-alcohol phosphatidyltransferase family protein [Nitrososphaerota archaeon]